MWCVLFNFLKLVFTGHSLKGLRVTYQSSQPEGYVDAIWGFQIFTSQLKPHQQLNTAKDHHDNLGRERARTGWSVDSVHSCPRVCLSSYALNHCCIWCVTPRLLGSFWTKRCRGLLDISTLWSASWVLPFSALLSLVVDTVASMASKLHTVWWLCGGRQEEAIGPDVPSPLGRADLSREWLRWSTIKCRQMRHVRKTWVQEGTEADKNMAYLGIFMAEEPCET